MADGHPLKRSEHSNAAASDAVVSAPGAPDFEAVDRSLASLRSGDERAFERLVKTLGPRLCAFAYRYVRSEDEAKDLVQEVFAQIWANRDRLVIRDTVTTYLYRAVRNRASNVARSKRTATEAQYQLRLRANLRQSTALPEAEAVVQRSQLAAAVRRAIASLPARCALAFTLVQEHGLTYAEAADVMGVSPKTIDVQIGRAMRALRERLRGVWP